jgi:hypothetical protein
MAIRKQTRKQRIAGVGTNMQRAQSQQVPIAQQATKGGTYGTVTGSQASPPGPMTIPMAAISVRYPHTQQYPYPGYAAVTVAYSDLPPALWGPNGEPLPSGPAGSWGTVVPAGRR